MLITCVGSGLTRGEQLEIIPSSGERFSEMVKLKQLPRMMAIGHGNGEKRQLRRLEHDELVSELLEVSGSQPEVFARDSFYHIPVDHSVITMIKWFTGMLLKKQVEYRPEAWDCDDFALAMTTFAEISAGHDYDLQHGFAWATMIVHQEVKWARVPAGGAHELVLMHTDKGFLVVEPQNGLHIPLAEYPNRQHIHSIFFN